MTARPAVAQPVRPLVDVFTIPFWEDDYASWHTLYLADSIFLGKCEVDATISRKIESKSAAGSDGARIRDKGYEPGKVTLTLTLWEREHFTSLQGILPLINPRTHPAARVPFSIVHPQCAILGITDVYVEKLGTLKPSGDGLWTMSIECVEFTTPTRRNVTRVPAASADAGLQTAFVDVDAAHPGQARATLQPIPAPTPSAAATGPRRR